ncbi:MAG: stage II sporulation protein M [Bacillaceae bacterium]|nr:stage II sporulation protein M [Bacillaceae bacterium]
MELKTFIRHHRKDWQELENVITMLSRRKNNVTPELLDRFESLYQKTSYHLSYSQTYFPGEDVTVYLNDLVSRAHNLLYRDQTSSLHQIRHFFGQTFIRLLSEQWVFVVVAFILFMIGAAGGFITVLNDPLHLYSVLPDEMAGAIDPERLGEADGTIDAPSVSASIMANNIQVAFLAFAGGISFGLITVYVLIYNGLLVGALAALFWHYSKFYEFWAYIVPHGMIELTAIFIAGGAGLLMGYRILVPGPYPRKFQLKRQALRSVQLLLGTIPLFVIAGLIEGYITPAPISLEAKYIVALLTVIGLLIYILLGRRLLPQKQADNATTHPGS